MESTPCLLQPKKVIPAKSFKPEKLQSRMDGPDGGWAWCVAFAACMINFIMAGLGRMSGILYVAFIDLFHVDRKGAAAPFSVRSSVRNLLGPIVGILGQKYGVRTVSITGGIIGSISAASCFYTNDITWITIIWGGVNGLGTALTTTLPQVVIGQYFKRHRTTASGMAFSGGCVGAFMFPALLEYLLQHYGLSGTFLIMGGIIMHTIPAAMILRKPSWIKAENRKAALEKKLAADTADHAETGDAAVVDDVFTSPPPKPIHRSVIVSEVDETEKFITPQKRTSYRNSVKSFHDIDEEVSENPQKRMSYIKSLHDIEEEVTENADESEAAAVDDVFSSPPPKPVHRSVIVSEVDETKKFTTPQKHTSYRNEVSENAQKRMSYRKSIKSLHDIEEEMSKSAVDVQFLRNNMDLVWKVILTLVKNREASDKVINGGTLIHDGLEVRKDKCPIKNELEDMYQKLENKLRNDSCDDVFVSAMHNRVAFLKSVDYDDVFTTTRNAKSQSHFYETYKAANLNNRIHSTGGLDGNDDMRMLFVLTLLRELCSNENKNSVSNNNQTVDQKVVDELCKAYKQLNVSESDVFESKDVFESRNSVSVPSKAPCSISANESDIAKQKTETVEHQKAAKDDKDEEKNGFFDHMKTAVKLYKNPLFLLICVCRAVHFITFIPVVTVVVDFGMDKGLLAEDGKYIIAALSIGDLVGRLGLGWITDRGYMSLPKYMLGVMILQGISTASLPFMESRALLLPTIALFGVLQGSVFIRHPVLVSTYMSNKEQSIGMGCINFLSGFIGFGLPSYIGYFRDTLGSYDNMFYITGAIGTSIGLLWILEPYLMKCATTEDTDDKAPSEDV